MNILVEQVAQQMIAKSMTLSVAESCTGGWVAKVLTDLPGSSAWFDRGYVTYSNEAKQEMLGVREGTLNTYGAVSENTVAEMVEGIIAASKADIALSVSGIAGPGGRTEEKPVGTVCFAWLTKSGQMKVSTRCFQGNRESVRYQSVNYAIEGVLSLLMNDEN